MRAERLAAIIVSWNSDQYIERCLRSLMAQARRADRIVVVDNASTDGSLGCLAKFGGAIEIVRLPRNIGFAAANNRALQAVRDCQWTVLLNPDAFAEPDWLEQLLHAAASNPQVSCFASRMLDDHDPSLLDGAGDSYHFTGMPGRRGCGAKAVNRYLAQEEVFAPCAGAALYRRDVILDAGGFDESFFCYLEDMDLGFRLNLLGHRCLYVPTAVVRHVGSGSTGEESDVSVYYGHRNLVWTFFKNMPWPLIVVLIAPHLVMNLGVVLWFAARGKGELILKAKRDALYGLGRVFRQRRLVANSRKRSVIQVAALLSLRAYR